MVDQGIRSGLDVPTRGVLHISCFRELGDAIDECVLEEVGEPVHALALHSSGTTSVGVMSR